jgi:two-component system OmpR family response regulator
LTPDAFEAPAPKTILLVDDDEDLRTHVGRYLREHEFNVVLAHDAVGLAQTLVERTVDLIILDVMLPGEDGLSICRRLTAKKAPPVIMLSAMGEELDRIVGLEVGADDYIPKPCSPRELLARVRAVLRRRGGWGSQPGATASGALVSAIHFDGFILNLLRRQLYAPDGSVIVLSSNEFALLATLLEHANEIMSREQLTRVVGLGAPQEMARAVDMQISRLRRKLHAQAGSEIIATIRGQGYRLAAHAIHGPHGLPAPQAGRRRPDPSAKPE